MSYWAYGINKTGVQKKVLHPKIHKLQPQMLDMPSKKEALEAESRNVSVVNKITQLDPQVQWTVF
ncbi:hypothetical protein T4A_1041 [Trichinella pseudospiralis]|uniref:Uncharacterized protein n=1 Tax=Trichinella pseudospiralis TaxID=6337 RepID=A0A0V1E7N8_TRIPS|nr:hypothetical protein T4A_1041 [Trichinella pseudospiralis]